jgi:hypothetical protein
MPFADAALQVNLMRLLNLACGHFEAYSAQHHKRLISIVLASARFWLFPLRANDSPCPYAEQFRSASGAVRIEVPSEEDSAVPTGEPTPTGGINMEDFMADVDTAKVWIELVGFLLLGPPGALLVLPFSVSSVAPLLISVFRSCALY